MGALPRNVRLLAIAALMLRAPSAQPREPAVVAEALVPATDFPGKMLMATCVQHAFPETSLTLTTA